LPVTGIATIVAAPIPVVLRVAVAYTAVLALQGSETVAAAYVRLPLKVAVPFPADDFFR
jgi:pyruvate/2-oxoglutarate/acetoin dehydrogenase E1 component